MHQLGLEGVVRGARALDLVQRDFTATPPNPLRVADFTYQVRRVRGVRGR
jgi:hypothetical protein